MQSGLDIVGICDSDAGNLALGRETAASCDPVLSDDASELLDSCRPDLVGVATTSPAHAEYSALALDKGARVVICEKPFANQLAAADRLVARARAADVVVAVNHQMRFMDQYVKVREYLDSGRFGRLTSMNVLGGNFGLATNGSHYFEAFRYLTDEPLVSMQAWLDEKEIPNPRGPQFRDVSGVVRGRSASGIRFSMDASADQGHGMAVHYGTQHGQIYVSEFDGEIHVSYREEAHRDMPTTRYGMPWIRETARFMPPDNLGPTTAVYRAALAGDNYPTAEQGAQVVQLLAACYLSHARDGARVSVDDADLEMDRVYAWP